MDQHNTQAIWQEALALIAGQLNAGTYRIWFESTRGQGFVDDTFVIGVPSDFAKDWIDTRFHALIADAVSTVVGDVVPIRIVVSAEAATAPDSTAETPAGGGNGTGPGAGGGDELDLTRETPAVTAGPVRRSSAPLNDKYTFDTFVIGPSNRFAHAAALAAAETPGTPTTRSSSTEAWAWARPTSFRRSATTCSATSRTSRSAT